jgi:thymidine phosphorylase
MTQPLGYAIGNALEIREAVHTLSPANVQASSFSHSSNNARFRELCITLAAAGIELAGIATGAESVEKANEALETGAAYRAFERIVEAQGGDISVLRHPERLAQAPVVHTITARTEGYIAAFDTRELGNIVVALGGGRATKEDTIDPSVGLLIGSGIGAYCAADSPLAEIHARTEQEATAAAVRVRAAIRLSSTPVPAPPLVIDRISAP